VRFKITILKCRFFLRFQIAIYKNAISKQFILYDLVWFKIKFIIYEITILNTPEKRKINLTYGFGGGRGN
jgi:hypothetical protein